MKPTELLSAQLIDILFSDRNKLYGAYELRKTYSRRINTALFITLFFAGAAFGAAALASGAKKKIPTLRSDEGIVLTAVEEKKIKEPLPEPELRPKPEPVQTRIFTTPQIVEVVQHPTPDQPTFDSVQIGDQNIFEGQKAGDQVDFPKEPGPGTGIADPTKKAPEDIIVTHVEIDAKFIGDWVRFLL